MEAKMKVTIRVETTTFETTHAGETIDAGTVKALTSRKAASWDDVKANALALTHQPAQEVEEVQTEIDMTPDPLEVSDVNYTDVSPEELAKEYVYDLASMTPANTIPAE
jgi:hypothetical protein